MSHRAKSIAGAIVMWQLACLVMYYTCSFCVWSVFTLVYIAWCGDVQASYITFYRVGTYVWIIVQTAPASLMTLWFFDFFAWHAVPPGPLGVRRRKPLLLMFVAWQIGVVAVLIWSLETGFAEKIHMIDWELFGPIDEIYSFRTLVLPHLIAWLICTTPVAWAALWVHDKGSVARRDRLSGTGE
jgi:hypothetical protein